ncbi:hypothetical protein [Fusobacterium polymorphum]|uniref:hypothetical protein n=1 Tax=Fusobacterium nucleatum subsp. polymorphum TaxID=76857 RepID=UPI003008ECA9
MIGSILLGGALGLIRGYNTKRQGKGIIRTADGIKKSYEDLSNLKPVFKKSLKEHKETVGKIKKYQEDTAKSQYDRENSKLKDSLESGIRNVINQYVAARENLKEHILDTKDKILMSTPTRNVESSSLQYDAMATLNKEATENQRTLLENQVNTIGQVTDENLEQKYRLDTDYDNTLGAIKRNYETSIANAENQYTEDINRLDNWIDSGKATAEQLRNQGRNTYTQGWNMINNTLLETGLNLYDYYYKPKEVDDIYDKNVTSTPSSTDKNVRGFDTYNPFRSSNPFDISNVNKRKFNLLGGNNGIFR